MQTDEEVGKVAQAVPVIIYILLWFFPFRLMHLSGYDNDIFFKNHSNFWWGIVK